MMTLQYIVKSKISRERILWNLIIHQLKKLASALHQLHGHGILIEQPVASDELASVLHLPDEMSVALGLLPLSVMLKF